MLRGWLVPITLFFVGAVLAAPIWPYNHDGLPHLTAWIVPFTFLSVIVGMIIVAVLEHR